MNNGVNVKHHRAAGEHPKVSDERCARDDALGGGCGRLEERRGTQLDRSNEASERRGCLLLWLRLLLQWRALVARCARRRQTLSGSVSSGRGRRTRGRAQVEEREAVAAGRHVARAHAPPHVRRVRARRLNPVRRVPAADCRQLRAVQLGAHLRVSIVRHSSRRVQFTH